MVENNKFPADASSHLKISHISLSSILLSSMLVCNAKLYHLSLGKAASIRDRGLLGSTSHLRVIHNQSTSSKWHVSASGYPVWNKQKAAGTGGKVSNCDKLPPAI